MNNILAFLFFAIIFFSSTNQAQNFWQQSDFPSYYSGEILSIYARNNLVLASSYQNGLGLSTNYGETWFASSPTSNYQTYSSVAINNSGFLFALGYDGYLYRSTDIGTTWTQCSTIQFLNSYDDMKVSDNGNIFIGCFEGVYRSTNSGDSWSLQNSGLIIGGSSPFVHINVSSNGILVAATPSGIFKSTNYANSWQRISLIGATNLSVDSQGYVFADKYREDPYLYIDTLYKTTNNGTSWHPLRQWSGSFIYVNPEDDAIALADYEYTSNYFYSSDKGTSWTTITTDKSPVCLTYDGSENFFMGTDEIGIFKSNSFNGSWQPHCNGFPGFVTKVSSVIGNSGIIFAATNSFGLFSSPDNGISFTKIYPGLNYINKLSATSNSYMFAIDGSIPRSTDLGVFWSYYSSGVLYDLATYSLCTNVSTILTGGQRNQVDAELDRSSDNGENWDEVLSLIGNYNLLKYKVIALAMTNSIALGCVEKAQYTFIPPYWTWIYSYAIIRSTNDGLNWSTTDFNYSKIVDFAWNYSNEVFAITSAGLLKSTDNGLTWNYTTGTLPTLNLKSTVISYDDDIYIGTGNRGVIISNDKGISWNFINQGMTDTVVNSLMISPTGFLFAGTEHGGVFRSNEPITFVENIMINSNKTFYLSQNYPNPFNPVTSIQYAVSSRQFVSLKVFDVLGNEVATLVNEEKPAGEYEVEFGVYSDEGQNLSSGVYFYQLRVTYPETSSGQGFVQTKKMVLLR